MFDLKSPTIYGLISPHMIHLHLTSRLSQVNVSPKFSSCKTYRVMVHNLQPSLALNIGSRTWLQSCCVSFRLYNFWIYWIQYLGGSWCLSLWILNNLGATLNFSFFNLSLASLIFACHIDSTCSIVCNVHPQLCTLFFNCFRLISNGA